MGRVELPLLAVLYLVRGNEGLNGDDDTAFGVYGGLGVAGLDERPLELFMIRDSGSVKFRCALSGGSTDFRFERRGFFAAKSITAILTVFG